MKLYECPDCLQQYALMADFLAHDCFDEDASGTLRKRKPKNHNKTGKYYEDD